MDAATLAWPFFEERHRTLARELRGWAEREVPALVAHAHDGHAAADDACRALVRSLGTSGYLKLEVPAIAGGAHDTLDVRTLCIVRETLARIAPLADFAFAMQGLGSGPISLFGTPAQQKRWLPRVASGEAIAAFAISESQAGSDVAAMRTTARRDGDAWIIDGEKTWISNAGIADQYVVFCKLHASERDFVALIVDRTDAGFSTTARIDTLAPHPLGTITFTNCRVPDDRLVGEAGKGLRVALGTLDVFRSTVGAAALGFARRAMDEAVNFAAERQLFGKTLAEYQVAQQKLARMATEIDASALLVYRAAWTRDNGAPRITREAAMAKMYATEAAQRVIDDAVQLLGARGVVSGHPVEQLYREIRALRIYEGTTEVQQLVIAGQLMQSHNASGARNG